jgi:hypothetical protein
MLSSFASGAAVGAASEATASLLHSGVAPGTEALVSAAVQRGIFSVAIGKYFGWLAGAGFKSPLRMLAFDQAVGTWAVNAFFLTTHALIVQRKNLAGVLAVLRQLPRVVLSGMIVWGPANAISMFYIPAEYRMYWSLLIGYFWGVYLTLRQKKTAPKKDTRK